MLRDIFRRNMGYKTISLVLAIIFWLWITSQSEGTGLFGRHTWDIPLVTYNQPPNLVIVSKVSYVTVSLDNNNQSISVKDLFAYVDLKDAVAGEHSFQVQVDAPQGVAIEEISPRSVVLRLEPVKDKILPVVAKTSGTPSSGYTAGEPIITPPVVNVRGPSSILEKLESVYVEVNVSGVKDSMRVARPVMYEDVGNKGIFASNPSLESLNAFPDTVEVIVPIHPKGIASKMVPLRVSPRGTPAEGMTVRALTPLPSQVQIQGDEEILKILQFISLGTIDVSGFTHNRAINIPIETINLPEGISFSEGTKISVLATVGPASTNRVLSDIPVSVRNIGLGLTADPIPPVSITISGYPDVLDNLQPGDVSVWIDVVDMGAGNYPETTLLWKAPSGVAMVDVPKVNLVLKSTGPIPPATGGDSQKVGGADFALPVQNINNSAQR